jgi:hypothetical protein
MTRKHLMDVDEAIAYIEQKATEAGKKELPNFEIDLTSLHLTEEAKTTLYEISCGDDILTLARLPADYIEEPENEYRN